MIIYDYHLLLLIFDILLCFSFYFFYFISYFIFAPNAAQSRAFPLVIARVSWRSCVHFPAIASIPSPQVLAEEFNPLVSAHCERGYMTINVITKHPFNGIIHTRDFRNNSLCSVTGTAARNTTLRISAVAVR